MNKTIATLLVLVTTIAAFAQSSIRISSGPVFSTWNQYSFETERKNGNRYMPGSFLSVDYRYHFPKKWFLSVGAQYVIKGTVLGQAVLYRTSYPVGPYALGVRLQTRIHYVQPTATFGYLYQKNNLKLGACLGVYGGYALVAKEKQNFRHPMTPDAEIANHEKQQLDFNEDFPLFKRGDFGGILGVEMSIGGGAVEWFTSIVYQHGFLYLIEKEAAQSMIDNGSWRKNPQNRSILWQTGIVVNLQTKKDE